jgi:hypothetical protein
MVCRTSTIRTADHQIAAQDDRKGDQPRSRRRTKRSSPRDQPAGRAAPEDVREARQAAQRDAAPGPSTASSRRPARRPARSKTRPCWTPAIVTNANAVEHHETCRYGTLIASAEELGHDDAVHWPPLLIHGGRCSGTAIPKPKEPDRSGRPYITVAVVCWSLRHDEAQMRWNARGLNSFSDHDRLTFPIA